GRVRDVRDAREPVELDTVAARAPREPPRGAPAERRRLVELARERAHAGARPLEQESDLRVARRVLRAAGSIDLLRCLARVALPALLDLAQAVVERVDERRAALRTLEQIVLKVGIARDDPDVAEHLVEHARGAAGPPLGAQREQRPPRLLPEEPDDDLA